MNTDKKYLTYKPTLFYRNVDLMRLIKKYGAPLRVSCPDSISEKIVGLKKCYQKSIKKYHYPGKYIYATANKSNYTSFIVVESIKYADQVETSSYMDLCLVEDVFKKYHFHKTIICNGTKTDEYIEKIISMHNRNFSIVDVIDSTREFDYLKRSKLIKPLSIGLRINLINIYRQTAIAAKADKFGLTNEDLNYIHKQINSQFKVIMVHFHQRTSKFYEEKALSNIKIIFNNHLVKLLKRYKTITSLNLGGGVPYDKIGEIDYQKYTDHIISCLSRLCKQHKIKNLDVVQENGRYATSDSEFYIYQIIDKKVNNGNTWYIVNDSLMTILPNSWAFYEDFLVKPINLISHPKQKVFLAGVTCDCDDVYYFQSREGYLKLPIFHQGEKLYLGVFGIGAYQAILTGRGGVHHCLIPEAKYLLIKKGKVQVLHNQQSLSDIKKNLFYQKI